MLQQGAKGGRGVVRIHAPKNLSPILTFTTSATIERDIAVGRSYECGKVVYAATRQLYDSYWLLI